MPLLTTDHRWLFLSKVYSGCAIDVENLLNNSDVNINVLKTPKDGDTALHLAVRGYIDEVDKRKQFAYFKIVELLLQQGADLNIPNKYGKTAVQDALLRGDINLIQLLIKKKSTSRKYPYQMPQNRTTPTVVQFFRQNQTTYCLSPIDYLILLFFAVRIGDEKGFRIILKKNPSLNVDAYRPYTDRPIIHYVVDKGTCKMIKHLVDHGCNIDKVDEKGASSLRNAIMSNQTDKALSILEFGASVYLENQHGETALHLAASESNLEVTKKLLDMGMDVNIKCKVGRTTPLHVAVNQTGEKSNEVVKLLLRNGADLDAGDYLGVTPFHTVCLKGDLSIILHCLKSGVNLYSRCVLGNNALHYASQRRSSKTDVIKILLQYGVDVNSIIFPDCTLLQLVVCSKHYGLVKGSYYGDLIDCLLEYNADVDVQDKRGETPLSFTLSKSSSLNNVTKLLVAHLALKIASTSRVCEKNLKMIENPIVHHFYTDCVSEISKMKTKISSNSYISYMDFLTKDIHKLSAFFRNKEIVNRLKSSDFKCFPIYGSLLRRKMYRAKTRALLIQEAKIIFCNNIRRNLPDVLLSDIFSYINEIELRFFVEDFSEAK